MHDSRTEDLINSILNHRCNAGMDREDEHALFERIKDKSPQELRKELAKLRR